MNKIKELKKYNFTPIIIALAVFFRAYLLSDRRHVGVEGFYPLEFGFSAQSIALLSLLIVFAVLVSFVLTKLGRRYGDAVSYLSLLLVAEPLLFTKQDNCVNLFIWIIGLLFVLNAIAEKAFIPKEITLVIFLFVSCLLSENAIFLFVAPAVVLYVAGDIEKLITDAKRIIALIVSAIATGAGIFLNDYLVKNTPAFDSFIKTYSFSGHVYFKHIEYENVFLFFFAIPTVIFGVRFFAELFRNNKLVIEKPSKKTDKKVEKAVASYSPIPAVIAVVAAYALSVAGFIVAGSSAFYTINYIVPAAIISMLCSKNKVAEKALEKTNAFLSEHSFAVIVTVVFVCYIAVRVFFGDVDNIARFIIAV